GYSVVTDYFDSIVNHDPNFIFAHLNLSSANSLFAGRPDRTVDLLSQAIETVTPANPSYPFFLWTYKATDEILFLGNLEAAQNSYETAAKWASMREDELGDELAKRYSQTAQFLASDPDPTQAQFGAWMTTLALAKDSKTQVYILEQLKELGAKITVGSNGELDIKLPERA
ncbi:MAG: hypothetical protein AAGA80_26785, partial [Cyanobacteria bacterium P01_F01_bin.143]